MGLTSPASRFDLQHVGRGWYGWQDIASSLWSGRLNPTDHDLRDARTAGGIYIIARAGSAPRILGPKAEEVQYIGEGKSFGDRLAQFRNAAGFGRSQATQHGGGSRCRLSGAGSNEIWVALYTIGQDLPGYLAKALRVWFEAMALAEHHETFGRFPPWNDAHNLKDKPRR